MQKNNSEFTRRAWKIIRLALLWAREGGVFRKRLGISLNTLPNYIKSLRQGGRSGGSLIYGERELSFDATPIIHVKMYRPSSWRFKMPHIPCISNPQVLDDEYNSDFDEELEMDDDNLVKERFSNGGDNENGFDEEIDLKAEEFFYSQILWTNEVAKANNIYSTIEMPAD